jgi:molybdate/tungstate transport system ATP-binding protein
LLRLDALSLHKGNFCLKEITLDIKEGEYFVILGRTGSGKTLLLESIAGVHTVEGKLFLKEWEITSLPPEKRHIGFVYQDFMLFPNMNVEKNIRFAAKYGAQYEDESYFSELLSLLQIEHLLTREICALSGGEKQRVALARALYAKPEVLLLDEPLSAVDPTIRDAIMEMLKCIAVRFKMTIVHVTHNFREAAFLAQRMAVLLDGRIVQTGTADEVLTRPETLEVARFLGFKNIVEGSLLGSDERYISIDPNAMNLLKHTSDALSSVYEVTLQEVGYAVDHYKIYVLLEGTRLFLKMSKSVFDVLALYPGEKCFLSIDPKGVLPL